MTDPALSELRKAAEAAQAFPAGDREGDLARGVLALLDCLTAAERQRDEWKASFFTAQDRTNDAEARAERAERELAELREAMK